jgi:hypothetical protein
MNVSIKGGYMFGIRGMGGARGAGRPKPVPAFGGPGKPMGGRQYTQIFKDIKPLGPDKVPTFDIKSKHLQSVCYKINNISQNVVPIHTDTESSVSIVYKLPNEDFGKNVLTDFKYIKERMGELNELKASEGLDLGLQQEMDFLEGEFKLMIKDISGIAVSVKFIPEEDNETIINEKFDKINRDLQEKLDLIKEKYVLKTELEKIKEQTVPKQDLEKVKEEFANLQSRLDIQESEISVLKPTDEAHKNFILHKAFLSELNSMVEELGKNQEDLNINELQLLSDGLNLAKIFDKIVIQGEDTEKIDLIAYPPTITRIAKHLDKWNPKSEAGKQNYTGLFLGLVAITIGTFAFNKIFKPLAEDAKDLDNSLKLLKAKLEEIKDLTKELAPEEKEKIDERITSIEIKMHKKEIIVKNLIKALHLKDPDQVINEGLKIRSARIERNSRDSDFKSDLISPDIAKFPGGKKAVAFWSYHNEHSELRVSLDKIDNELVAIKQFLENPKG